MALLEEWRNLARVKNMLDSEEGWWVQCFPLLYTLYLLLPNVIRL